MVINITGPRPPRYRTTFATVFLVVSDNPLNHSKRLFSLSSNGVIICKNTSPTGAKDTFKSSIDLRNLFIAESAVIPNSFSARDARSSTEAFAKSSTRDA